MKTGIKILVGSVSILILFVVGLVIISSNDVDTDGILNSIDNCPELSNPTQSDFDGDKIGDDCDSDDDNDLILDEIDAFDTDLNEWADFDSDGIGSNQDVDDDNDGIFDVEDIDPTLSSEDLTAKYLEKIQDCVKIDRGTSRLLCYSEFFKNIVEEKTNNSDALELSIALSKLGAIDDCHFVSHEIGHVAYKERPNVIENLRGMDGTMCRGGFFHGVLASYFHDIEEAGEPFPSTYGKICDDLIGSSNYQDCIHGLGHGLVHYFDVDLDSAINSCNNLSYYQNRLCMAGVMMQYTDNELKRNGVSKDSLSNTCVQSELNRLEFQECSITIGSTLAFHTGHNFEDGKKSCELLDNQEKRDLCLAGLKLEIDESKRYEINPLNLEIREKYQPQFLDENTIIDIRSPAIISDFMYIPEIKLISFMVDREGYVIMFVPSDLLPEKTMITLNGQVPSNLVVDTTIIEQYVVIRFDSSGAGLVLISPSS